MIAFEVWLNGEKKCVAGDSKVLNAIVNGPPILNLRVGGMRGEEHVDWMSSPIQPGDEITIRVIETQIVDEPKTRSRSQTRAEKEARVRKFLKKACGLLPIPTRESHTATLGIFERCLRENNLMGAMDALESLGDLSGATSDFWNAICEAAHYQSAYEDRNRMSGKAKAAQKRTAQTDLETP